MKALSPFSLPGRFWRGNFHTHSNQSDGILPTSGVIEAYKNAGYDFVQMSEHFINHFDWPINDTRAFRANDFTTLIGVELHAPETSAGELWHILAAGLPLDFTPPGPQETGAELARRARDAGAFISIAHPAWSQLTLADGLAIDAAHSVEIYNHGCAIENDRGDGWYLLDQLLNEGKRLTANATDDAHFKTPDHFGGWVNVKAQSLDPDALLQALKDGHFYSSQGPEFNTIAVDKKEILISCSPVDTITVVCGNSRTCVKTGKAITSAVFDLERLNHGWLLNKPSPWFRVTAIDHAGKRAWSNPIWWDNVNFSC
jgi:predicted metal-dependent phosphoesterase TrpH